MSGIYSGACKDCEERKPGCHGVCEKYAEYKKQLEEFRQKREAVYEVDRYIIHAAVKRRGKKRRERGGKKWNDSENF